MPDQFRNVFVRPRPFIRNRTARSNAGISRSNGNAYGPLTPLTLEDARRVIQSYVDHYNTVRLHSAIGYVTPPDMLAGRQADVFGHQSKRLLGQ